MRELNRAGWLSAVVFAFVLSAAHAGAPAVGAIPPDVLGVGSGERSVRVSDFRGRVLIATFWASWCGPCIRELALLERLQQAVGHGRVAVVGVNWNDSEAQYRRLLARLQASPLTLTRDVDGRVGAAYAIRRIPRMFVIDQDGRVAYSHTGYDPETSIATIVDEVKALLRHPPASLLPPGA